MKESSRIAVVGSLNIDYLVRVDFLPRPGETLEAERLRISYGGKGANQAIAALRQGCEVVFFGALGSHREGQEYRKYLKEQGIHVTKVRSIGDRTGSAFITVAGNGENTIVTAPGANRELRKCDIERNAATIEACDAVLGQFEVPFAPLVEAARIANQCGLPVFLNPSPFLPAFPWEEILTDYLITNEGEAAEVLGFPLDQDAVAHVRNRLHEIRVENLIVTRGGEDTLVFTREGETFSVPTLPVVPVDTVGAGDAFAGCLAARIVSGESLMDALLAANCAGALTTLGCGAQDPVPDRENVDRHLAHLKSQL